MYISGIYGECCMEYLEKISQFNSLLENIMNYLTISYIFNFIKSTPILVNRVFVDLGGTSLYFY